MTKRNLISSLTWTGAAFAAVLVPAIASAQAAPEDQAIGVRERQKPEYEPLGIRAGAFMIRPDITVEAEYNDNVFAVPDGGIPGIPNAAAGPVDDMIYRITPSVRVQSNWSRNALGLRAKLVNWSYQDSGGEDRTDYDVGGDFRLDLGTRAEAHVSGGYLVNHDSRVNAASPINALEPIEYSSTYYGAGASQEFNRLKLTGDVTYRNYDYKDGINSVTLLPLDQDVRDYEQVEYAGRADYALNKGGVIFIEAAYNTRSYDNLDTNFAPALNQDSDGYRALVGTRIDISNLLRGEVAIGYQNQKYDDTRLGEISGLAARADLQWFVTGITTIGFGGAREVTESGIVGQPGGVLSTSVYARVDHELLRNVILSGDVAYRDYEYEGVNRTDDVTEAGVGVDYLLNRMLKLNLAYRYSDRTSDILTAEYSVNSIVLGITARF